MQKEARKFDVLDRRWPINAVLVWIATRDESRTAELGYDTVEEAGLHMCILESFGGISQPRPMSFWPELVEAMSSGAIKAIATRTLVSRLTSSEIIHPGQIFPPDHSPGRALSYAPFSNVVEGIEQSVLRPCQWVMAAEYEEWRDVVFSREDVVRTWPSKALNEPPKMRKMPFDEIAAKKLIKDAMHAGGGSITQEQGALLLMKMFEVKRAEARNFVSAVTGSRKPGPKGPRKR